MRIKWTPGEGWEIGSGLCSMSGAPDGGGGGGATQAPAATPEPAADPVEESLLDTLRFDPFADASPTPAKPSGAGASASPGQTPPRSAAPAQTPAPQGTQPQPADGAPGTAPAPTGVDALTAAAAQLAGAAERLQAPTAAQPGPQQQQQQDEIPPYIFDIPPQLVEALASENPQHRQAALQHLVAGTARAVHKNMVEMMNQVRMAMPQVIAQHLQAHTYRESIRADFYGKYPMLNNPNLAPVVANVTQQIMSEVAAAGGRPVWSEQMAKAIADRVFSIIPGLAAGQPQPQRPQPVAPQQPPLVFAPGSRPAAGNSVQADIESTLFG